MTTDELIRRTFANVIALYECRSGVEEVDSIVHAIAEDLENVMREANNDLCAKIYDEVTH